MRGKPFLVAFAAFAIVLIGGAAMAGIGTYWNIGSSPTVSAEPDDVQVTPTTSVPKATTTPIAAKEPEPEQVTSDKPVQQESDVAKETEPVDADDTDKDVQEPAPAFTLTHPEDGARFKSKVVAFGGTAGEGITVHRGKYEAIPKEGEWVMELVLSPGKNYVSFEGIDADGTATVASVTVYYDAPVDKGQDETAAFVAHQKYGSCSEEIPYDVFYGSAEPGAKITASSAYGGNSTVANKNGKWEMTVKFPDAPSGKTFNVKIKASTGQ
ncbi:MAG: hypothetical protein ACC683_05850, partial [Acidimicrobiia bacterium]